MNPQGQEDAPLTGTLCAKYGGNDAIKTLADKIIDHAAGDCRIAPAFAGADVAHIKECFQQQFGGSSQIACPGVTYSAGITKDSKGDKCRSMQDAHANINGKKIRLADYNAFVQAASAEFTAAGITDPNDLKSLASFFEGTKAGVVQNLTQPNANSFCTDVAACTTCKPAEAGIIDSGIDTGIVDSSADADGG